MTLNEIKKSAKTFLTAAEIAPVIGCDPHSIRWQAHHNPNKLGFPVTVIRSRVKIPRLSFIKYVEAEGREQS